MSWPPTVSVMSRPSEPSMSLALKSCTNSTVLAIRALSSAKGFSSSAYFATSAAGEPCRGALGEVRRDLDLAHQREHVGSEPPAQQDLRLDLALGGKGF